MGKIIFYHVFRLHMEVRDQKAVLSTPQKIGPRVARPTEPMVLTYLLCVEPGVSETELEAWEEEKEAIKKAISAGAPKVQALSSEAAVRSVFEAVVAAFPDRKSQVSGMDLFAEYVPSEKDVEKSPEPEDAGLLHFPR